MDKHCSRCGQVKPVSEFNHRKRSLDGYEYYCRQCNSEVHAAGYRKNPEPAKRRAAKRRSEEADELKVYFHNHYASHSESIKDRIRNYELTHAEQVSATHKAYHRKHRAELIAKKKVYYATHKPCFAICAGRRRARKKGVDNTLVVNEWRWLLEVCDYRCLACGTKSNITIDHVIPLNPGPHTLANVQPLCMACNRQKWATTIDYRPQWLRDMVDEMVDQYVFEARITPHTAKRLLPSTRQRLTIE